MRPGATTRDRWIWMASAVLLAATIALELVVPLGYAVWLAYFLAVGVTVFQRSALPLQQQRCGEVLRLRLELGPTTG